MTSLLTGTVTFLFTDIEGSTAILNRLGPDAFSSVLDHHNRLLREQFARGVEVSTEGDSFFYVFASAPDALAAVLAGQRALVGHDWPDGGNIRVRMGLHTGEGTLGGDNYVGIDVNKASRIADAAHGGQILVSSVTRMLGGSFGEVGFRDLGDHRFKGIPDAEKVYQLVVPDLTSDFPPIRSLELRPNNLPAPPSGFVGRERETAELSGLLENSRLVTVTGPGGAGKSRLALHVATQIQDRFAGGVFYVTLDGIGEADLVLPTIASACSVIEEEGRPTIDAVADRLDQQGSLLVLDTFEHVLGAAPRIGELLSKAPSLRTLVTSQALLRVRGEKAYPLPPLDQEEAVELFVARVRDTDSGFALDEASRAQVETLVRRLDCYPLALELAAARVRLFGLSDLVERISQHLASGASALVGTPERQRTLLAAIRWSYDLLTPEEQRALAELSVFESPFVLEAAEAILSSGDKIELVASLFDKSLLQRHISKGEVRFNMLDSIRLFGLERLAEMGAEADTRSRHGAYYAELGETALASLEGPGQDVLLDRLSEEFDELRAVVRNSLETGDPDDALTAVGGAWRFYHRRGHLLEGVEDLRQLLAVPANPGRPRAVGLNGLAALIYWQGRFEEAASAYHQLMALAQELGERILEAEALSSLGFTYAHLGRYDEQLVAAAEARRIFEDMGEVARARRATTAHAFSVWVSGDLELAERLWAEAEQMFVEVGDRAELLQTRVAQAVLAHQLGRTTEALDDFGPILQGQMDLGDVTGSIMTLEFMAPVLATVDPARAVILEAAGARLRTELGGGITPDQVGVPAATETARESLDEPEIERLRRESEDLSLEEAVALALGISHGASPDPALRAGLGNS
ncbi:MAG: adenylate/guanylate cyclase domain-containing protein [Acidimicrobiia bacterium]